MKSPEQARANALAADGALDAEQLAAIVARSARRRGSIGRCRLMRGRPGPVGRNLDEPHRPQAGRLDSAAKELSGTTMTWKYADFGVGLEGRIVDRFAGAERYKSTLLLRDIKGAVLLGCPF